MVEPRRKKSRLSIAARSCNRQQEVPPIQHDNDEEETSDDSTSSSSSHETRKQLLMKEAVKTLFKRKSIHQAIVANPDGRRQAANSNQAPFAVIAKGGKGAPKYQDYVLAFLDPAVWDREAPASPGEDGFMRGRAVLTPKRCRDPRNGGSWRKLICFVKKEDTRYSYLGTYEIVTEQPNGDQMIGEFDFPPIDPESVAGKTVLKALTQQKHYSPVEALEWLDDPANWRSTPIRFVDFDCELYCNIKAMEERRTRG
jgi:hypothetical protein